MATRPELTVVIPTHDRRDVLLETLRRLDAQETACAFEIVVVDDGSGDGSFDEARELAGRMSRPLTVLRQEQAGPAAARNRALEAAGGPVALFLGDDTWPSPQLVERHARFHRDRPDPADALLGRIAGAPELDGSPFMRWLESSGVRFAYDAIADPERVPGTFFYSSNVSAKVDLVAHAGGFHEEYLHAAAEDTDLGLRLERAGMRLAYDPEAAAYHYHPADLESTLRRMWAVGRGQATLASRIPDATRPAPPGPRHRVGAAVLWAASVALPQAERVRHETWRFLCHEATREAFWGVSPGPGRLRIGARLAARATRDPAAARPAPAREPALASE